MTILVHSILYHSSKIICIYYVFWILTNRNLNWWKYQGTQTNSKLERDTNEVINHFRISMEKERISNQAETIRESFLYGCDLSWIEEKDRYNNKYRFHKCYVYLFLLVHDKLDTH